MGFLGLFGSSGSKEVNRILKEMAALEEGAEERSELKDELRQLESNAIEPLDGWLKRAGKRLPPDWVMLDVCEVLSTLGVDGLQTLAQYARTDPAERRAAALLGLGMSRREEAVPVCLEAITTDDPQIVAAATTALRAIGSGSAVDKLAELLKDRSYQVATRAAIATTIAGLKSAKSAKAIIEAAEDPQLADVIPGCFGLLGPLVVPSIIDALGSPNELVRKTMVRALESVGDLGGPDAVQGIAKALRDRDSDVRSMAAQALQKRGEFRPLVASLKDEQFDNRFVLQALTAMGTKNTELMQAYASLLEQMGKKITSGSVFAVEKLREAEHFTPALRYLEEVTQYLPDDSDFMEPAIRLKREVRTALQSRRSRK
ncbi:MAG: HEAT repeat domain-containing protein [Acidobacteriota bacterium]